MIADDNLLDDIIKSSDDTFAEEDLILAPLAEEIQMIVDEPIRVFVRAMLVGATDFWRGPASSSGKTHPPDEHGEGGEVLHTRRVVHLVDAFCDSKDRTVTERDMLIAAALLHDVTKVVQSPDGEWMTDPMHPYTVDRVAAKVFNSDGNVQGSAALIVISPEVIAQILRLIHCSQGVWSPIPETMPLTVMEWILHDADYIATQLHKIPGVGFDGIESGPETPA